ncbi:MAG: prolyl oligopeptidase family serine peptidase [Deltaproteobacteria bacterium]|nr:prolyl oligopeptidase family serine peptidase [Deltaproteobacteria bacterium]
MYHRTAGAAVLGLLLMVTGTAGAALQGHSPWSVDDLILAESLGDWDVSPDGATVAWVRHTIEEVEGTEKQVSNLWLGHLDAEGSSQLTRGTDRISSPAFSPNGKIVAFLSSRKLPGKDTENLGKTQVWALPERGDAYPLTRFDRAVASFGWADDDTLIVLAPESPSAWEKERKEGKDTATVIDDLDHEPPVRLFRVDLEGKVRRLTRNLDYIRSLSVSPNGDWAVVTAQQELKYAFDHKVPPKTFLVNLATGESHQPFPNDKLLPFGAQWAPDSSGFYFANEYSRHPLYRTATITELYFFNLSSRKAAKVDLDWPRGLSGNYLPTTDGVLALLADGVTQRAGRISREGKGWKRTDLEGAHRSHIQSWKSSQDGKTLVYSSSSATRPTQLFSAKLDGSRLTAETAVSDLNSNFEKKNKGRVEAIRWQGAGGDEVEGILHYPLDWKEGSGPRPLVVDIHGGPAGTDMDRWDQRWAGPNVLFRQRGAFVFQINYHGSAGYGLDWVESIEGRYYEQETLDILNGVEHLIELGLVDPDKLGCTGWSNGGILTAELITRTERFKAASVGAADVEWISDWANVDFGASFDNYYFGGTPWEKLDHYIEKSPFFRLSEVTTPTIIYTGTEDRNVPPHQSWSLYRALQYLEKAPTRLVIFPGEPHGLRKVAHQRRRVEEELGWFDKYLFGSDPQRSPAIKKGSKLAALLDRHQASRVGEAFGAREAGKLVPETVTFQGLEVGRFAVTRAQFAAFDSKAAPSAGTENLPQTGISFDQARAYAQWLAETTDRPFRLPTREEAEKLAKKAGKGGNTLDHWAGFSPNPEDATVIRQSLAEVPGKAPLLLPVGSLPGVGENPVFDLDGNAAEWVEGKGGKGEVFGLSADRPKDDRQEEPTTDPDYIGLRVVVGD